MAGASAVPEHSEAGAEAPAFLGVATSLSGRRWRQRSGDDRLGLAIAQRLGVPEVVGRIIAGRGIPVDAVEQFLNPTLRGLLPDPSCLKDMDRAATRIAEAVIAGEPIAIFGDYDVDGATSSALLARFLGGLDADIRCYIPDRRLEGYGPNAPALLKLRDQGARVIITVDCGTTAHEPLRAAADAGIAVIVIDHHAAEPALPPAFAIVNPNRLDDDSGLGTLAAVGVAFLLVVAVNRALRQAGFYGAHRREPDLLQWLDLVALGTVCDVVPLTGLNRALVAQGIKVMAQRRNAGLVALADSAAVAERIDAYHLGYLLGPRVNAGGRVGKSDLGTRLLGTDDPGEAAEIAGILEALNTERREIEAQVLAEAVAQVEDGGAGTASIVLASGREWHPGVIGIVASRLKERYDRPACVIAWEPDPARPGQLIGKGSGRSVPGVDLGAAVIAARQTGLLIGGGGHRMAAGFTVAQEHYDAFAAFLESRVRDLAPAGGVVPEIGIDGALALGAATPELIATLSGLGPFGAGNAEPRFVLPRVRVAKADIVGSAHVRCFLVAGPGERLKAIAFRAVGTPLGDALLASSGAALHIAGHLRLDLWQGRSGVQMLIDDAAFAAGI